MKKIFVLMPIAALALAGCSINEPESVEVIDGNAPVFYASFEEEKSTKTYVDGQLHMYWNSGDRLSIFMNTYNQQYEFQGKTGDNAGLFKKVLDDGFVSGNTMSANYAVYPFDAETKIAYDGTIFLNLPSVQQYAEGSFGINANSMVAVTENTEDNYLAFKNLCGYLVLRLYGEDMIKSVTITGKAGEKIAGTASVLPEYGSDPYVVMSDEATCSVSIVCNGVSLGKTEDVSTEFWFCLPPVTFTEGFTVTVTDMAGMTMEKSVSSSHTLERNVVNFMAPLNVECEESMNRYLTFSAEDYQTIMLVNNNNNSPSVQYSYDAEKWYDWDYSPLLFGDSEHKNIHIRGDNPKGFSRGQYQTSHFSFGTVSKVECSGNVMSLIDYSKNVFTIPCSYCFKSLFDSCSSLVSAPALPATSLTDGCYYYMFAGCTSLALAPELPAMVVPPYCYNTMFYGCTSLVSAPDLPATSISMACYANMFYGCTNLVSAPSLPAMEIANSCYSYLFGLCSSLKDAPDLPATKLADYCYSNMFEGCSSLTKAPELPATSLAESCYHCMFSGCSSLDGPPELPATTLKTGCYSLMFNDCGSLAEAPLLPAKLLVTSCYSNMFRGCSSLTTAPELPAVVLAAGCYSGMFSYCTELEQCPILPLTSLSEGCYSFMFAGCTSITEAPQLPALMMAPSCYDNMFNGCVSLVSAPDLPAMVLAQSCYSGMFAACTGLTSAPKLNATILSENCYKEMFSGCTSLTTAPDLPALTLARDCYSKMFYKCNNLSYVKALFLTQPGTDYTNNWLYRVNYEGVFIKNRDASWDVNGDSGIPTGWTIMFE